MKRKKLISAAKEFNRVVTIDHPVNPKAITLEKDLFEALEFIEEGDSFTKKTDKIFNKLKIKYTPKTKMQTVAVGTTVDLDMDTDKIIIKNENEMSQKEAAEILLNKTTKKEEVLKLLKSSEVFAKKDKKELSKVTNFLSLKSQMKKKIDPDILAEVKAEIAKAKPKATPKPKVKKDSPIAKEVKEAIKVKQLKKIAKANPKKFDWRKLKGLEFDELQNAMVKMSFGKAAAKEPAKPKMIANPVIAEIKKFSKAKKLTKWAKETEGIEYKKSMKKMKINDLINDLIGQVPSEIEAPKRSVQVNHIDNEARKARLIGLIEEGKYTRRDLSAILKEEFSEEGKAHTNSNILSECKSTREYKDGIQRWERFGIGRLVVEDANGCYVFPEATKKSKKNKKVKSKK